MDYAPLCALRFPEKPAMDDGVQSVILESGTRNTDTASVIVGSTARVVKKNGTSKGGRANKGESGKNNVTTPKASRDSCHRVTKERERTRLPGGGRTDRDATGAKKGERRSEKDVDQVKASRGTLEEETENKKKKGELERLGKMSKRTPTQAGGRGRKRPDTARDSAVARTVKLSTNTGSGTSTYLRYRTETANPMDRHGQSDTGSDSRVTLVDIISKLFPSGIEEESTPSSAIPDKEQGTGSASSLDKTLVAVEALEDNFEHLASWFESFENTS